METEYGLLLPGVESPQVLTNCTFTDVVLVMHLFNLRQIRLDQIDAIVILSAISFV